MFNSLVSYIVNSPEKKRKRVNNPFEKLPKELVKDIRVSNIGEGHTVRSPPKGAVTSSDAFKSFQLFNGRAGISANINKVPLIDISQHYLNPNNRMKKDESIKVYELWNWYRQNVKRPTQTGFTQWCGLGIGLSGMSKKLKNPKFSSEKVLAPNKFWYSGCQHRCSLDMHLIHRQKNPETADYVCGDCNGTTMAMARDKHCNEALTECLDLLCGLEEHNWPDEFITIDVTQVVNEHLKPLVPVDIWSRLNAQFDFQVATRMPLRVHRYNVAPARIVGPSANVGSASYPRGMVPHERDVLGNLNDGSYGLIVFGEENSNRDFVFIGDSGLSNECIRKVSEMESFEMGTMQTTRRAGTATGQFIPVYDDYAFNPKGLSNATKNERVYRIDPNGDTTILKLDYWSNCSDRPCHARVINKDIIMNRITKRAKRKLAMSSSVYREKLIAKMKNQFLALVSVCHEGLHASNEKNGEDSPWNVLVKSLRKLMDPHFVMEWRSVNPEISDWDVVLLEWNCMYGEDLTHQATKCHIDGMGPETYSLWGKVATNDPRSNKEIVDSMDDGYLVFPHHGMSLRVRCGRDSVTMSLQETMHCGDSTRGSKNFSSIDWSRGK